MMAAAGQKGDFSGARKGFAALLIFLCVSIPLQGSVQQATNAQANDFCGNRVIAVDELHQAIRLSAGYLDRFCNKEGEFVYQVNADNNATLNKYNIVRHCGAMYATACYFALDSDPKALLLLERASRYLKEKYVSPYPAAQGGDRLIVWSDPVSVHGDRTTVLGANALGLVGLTSLEHFKPNSTPIQNLEAMGNFIVFLQHPDGSFLENCYSTKNGGTPGRTTCLYYPGEAALALIDLYDLDHSERWLKSGEEALGYLAERRKNCERVPADHWALIATARLFHVCGNDLDASLKSSLIRQAKQIVTTILSQQILNDPSDYIYGGFANGNRNSARNAIYASIRLEGLLAAMEFLPRDSSDLRGRTEMAIKRGIAFLLRSQIQSGTYSGGFPRLVTQEKSPSGSGDNKAATNTSNANQIRIDYVQHALGALIRYQEQFGLPLK